ncbi:ABC transporter permease [Bradyrhizobium elkanii]|uniref:ABC transporter permease n=1 Tax=Bradyrhizobium elkanii TaxID=29448 RepID=UPI002226E444|nr:ABC transporter permease [Bradyrhizobium elkanii]MCW2124685.1 ABC-2 type transport system permease protein/lipopolysaccharide transport system permease protein [Bradyrhizobium elkanii]MCW2171432.1 ABC-2 type transport system permease protein/lipopolysaccharide transport system permease protein [Bradyrhizobium elkanii]
MPVKRNRLGRMPVFGTSSMPLDQPSTRGTGKDALGMTNKRIGTSGSQTPSSGLTSNERKSRASLAIADMASAARQRRLWLRLGWNDIMQRYRRSVLGPLWLTVSMAIMIVSLGLLYAQIFQSRIDDFLPYLCVGFLVWGYFSSFLTEAGLLFVGSETYIKQIKLPYALYVCRGTWSKVIIFAHNFVIYLGVMAYFHNWPGANALLAVPGFLLLTINGALVTLFIGMASARFRDIPQVIGSLVQILFFITPIMWKSDQLKDRTLIVDWNPLYHLIQIVREPLLGDIPTANTYVVVITMTLINLVVVGLFFGRFRERISYWV